MFKFLAVSISLLSFNCLASQLEPDSVLKFRKQDSQSKVKMVLTKSPRINFLTTGIVTTPTILFPNTPQGQIPGLGVLVSAQSGYTVSVTGVGSHAGSSYLWAQWTDCVGATLTSTTACSISFR